MFGDNKTISHSFFLSMEMENKMSEILKENENKETKILMSLENNSL